MLTLTDQAVEVIRKIVEESKVGPDGGLRISGTGEEDGESALEFELTEAAQDGDEAVRQDGAVVFLDETAAEVLADKRLDVHAHGDHFHFSVEDLEEA
jgi:Fe-S cluster assembly iron-binding protein IscA